jgi:S-adenosylmethionine/arginine decarboxylase-like enzyme
MNYWGYHLILDCSDCLRTAITEPAILTKFTKTLVRAIDMVPYGPPQIIHFGHNQPGLAGYTIIQLIETSNITAHFCDSTGEGYIDIFSCKPFNENMAVGVVEQFFNPKNIRKVFLTRQA